MDLKQLERANHLAFRLRKLREQIGLLQSDSASVSVRIFRSESHTTDEVGLDKQAVLDLMISTREGLISDLRDLGVTP